MISDHRILSDDGQFVTIRIKDYKAGDIKAFTLPAVEFVRRWVMHILPKHLARVRYGGIFAPQQREERLTHCAELIGQAKLIASSSESRLSTIESPPAFELEEEYIDDEPPGSKCQCRYCQGEMVLLGRLQGTETQAMRSLSEAILFTLRTTLLSVIGNDTAKQLLIQLRAAWLMPKYTIAKLQLIAQLHRELGLPHIPRLIPSSSKLSFSSHSSIPEIASPQVRTKKTAFLPQKSVGRQDSCLMPGRTNREIRSIENREV